MKKKNVFYSKWKRETYCFGSPSTRFFRLPLYPHWGRKITSRRTKQKGTPTAS